MTKKHFALLAVFVALVHFPSLWLGAIHDDLHVLGKCEKLSFVSLLRDGFKFHPLMVGNPWWFEKEVVAQYFRPVLLISFKIPIVLFGQQYWIQHLINIVLHIFNVWLVFYLGSFLFSSAYSALLAACFFGFSVHSLVPVHWIVSRKELLVSFFMLISFASHLKRKAVIELLSFAGALGTGEHAVMFPFIVAFWDIWQKLFSKDSTKDTVNFGSSCEKTVAENGAQGLKSRSNFRLYFSLFFLLILYVFIRTKFLQGLPLPAEPYFEHPTSPGFLIHSAWKFFMLLVSFFLPIGFIDRILIIIWVEYPTVLAIFCSVILTGFFAQYWFVENMRLWSAFLLSAFIAYLPFLPMFAAPFYIYTPFIFFCLSLGVASDGAIQSLEKKKIGSKLFLILVAEMILLNGVVCFIISWGSWPWQWVFRLPQHLAPRLAKLIEKYPPDQKIFFVDVPLLGINFFKPLADLTGRDAKDWGTLTARIGFVSPRKTRVDRHGSKKFQVSALEIPFFSWSLERMALFVPDNRMYVGRKVDRTWFSVTIKEIGNEKYFRKRHLSALTTERGVKSLSVDVSEGTAEPIVIQFEKFEPKVLEFPPTPGN